MTEFPKPGKKPKRNPQAAWRKEKAAWLAEHPNCQVRFYPDAGPCSGPIQVHHHTARGMGGSRRKLPLVTACMGHHQKIESQREWAKSVGLLATGADRPMNDPR